MWKGLKKKNILLILGVCAALLFCYRLAISKTLDLRKELRSLEVEEQRYGNVPGQLLSLSKKEVHLDSVLLQLDLSGTSLENDLLRTLNIESEKNGLKVIDFDPPHIFEENSTLTKTHGFALRGPFNALVKLLYALEQQPTFGQIVHLDIVRQRNHRTRKDYLEATVFIQRLE